MVSSIALGTLLRQRYFIKQVIGQGGFGRTYLAVDQERFDELCVIKEFTVPYQDDALIEKAKTLFQREASTLYQIQHPQIPRFWAAFESEQRLFLVQDFVQGQTYRSLLQARKQQEQSFSEAEVLYLLDHLLPVLSYLHDRDIVHRDISPDNIILKSAQSREIVIPATASAVDPALPILIDFGAVKEATSHWPIVSTLTRVGKVGYAPPEQLQTGNVSPHSDIYALGATCLVLLTGREPQNLLDSQTLAWHWQPYVQLNDLLATVLQKMVALHPGDRYQSARETWADLQPLLHSAKSTLLNPTPQPIHSSTPERQNNPDIAPAARDSEKQATTTIRTHLFMMKNSDEASGTPEKSSPHSKTRPSSKGASVLLNYYAVPISIAASLVVATGIGAHLFRTTAPLASTQQIKTESTSPTNAIISTGEPRRIEFPPGGVSAVTRGNLQDRFSQPYTIEANQGQIMTVTLEGTGVMMNLLRSNGEEIDQSAKQTRTWTGPLPTSGEYKIEVTGSGPYSLDVAITPLTNFDNFDTQRVKFPRGKRSTTVTGKTQSGQVRRFLLKAKAQQIMRARVLQGNVSLTAIAPNGQNLGASVDSGRLWQQRLPIDGEYVIEVTSRKPEDFVLMFEIF